MIAFAAQCAQALDRARLYEAERAAREAAEAARAEAEAANQAKSRFLRTMSHELRTPLNAIGGYAQLLEMGLHGAVTAQQMDALRRIQRANTHLIGLVSDILDFARVEAGQIELRMAPVPVSAILEDLETIIAPQARSMGLEYTSRFASGSDVVLWGDAERVRQILLNLLSNAVKFTEPGGSVWTECDVSGPSVRIRVSDTGRGIPAESLAAVFDPFVQVERERTPGSQQGVGLGLAISRDLAVAMGGGISAESTPGVGSAFTLTLPRYAIDPNGSHRAS